MDLTTVSSHRLARRREDLILGVGETLLAGGTWLFSEPQPATTGLVDLTTLGWPDLEQLPDGSLRIAATCPVAVLRERGGVFAWCADALLMSPKVQAVATVGGNVCLGLPAGAMTSLLAGLDATALVWPPAGGERVVRVADLVVGNAATSLTSGEVVRCFDVPAASLAAPVAHRRFSLADLGRSAGVVIGLRTADGVRVTVTGSTTRPVVLADGQGVEAIDCWHEDAHGARDWRVAQTARCLAEVREELG
ncbi:FAD binding domain-containing protein [uncultured Nocardioides sp.]|uniref:FAD binding domain-containing protein n=1 Tax=uncultured Nocardioides sp. TaxID=198441 RepID=UPI00260BE2EC|nr:FAD binding domain-containing protein [uncultured Nocardioides sp.]